RDTADAARLKGDDRMARVLTQAVGDRERGVPAAVALLWNGQRVRLSVRESRRLVEQVKRRRGTHNERRPQVERLLIRHLVAQLVLEEDEDREAVGRTLRADRAVVTALERMWPILTAE